MKNPWFAFNKANPHAQARLFCLPYAGGNATIYRSWVNLFPATVEVLPVELPGRGARMREAPLLSTSDLIPLVGAALLPHLDRPFALFGHSMGALLTFELARWLAANGHPQPGLLCVSAHRAPHLPSTDASTHALPDGDLIGKMGTLNGTPPELLGHPELMELMLPVIRADFTLCDLYAYEAGPPLDAPIFALGGLQDPMVSREQLDAWKEQTTAGFKLQMLYGDHFFLQTAQQMVTTLVAQEVAQALRLTV